MDLLEAPFPVDKSKINDLQRYQSKNRTRLARQTKSCRTIFHVRRTFSVFAKTQLEVDRLFLEFRSKKWLEFKRIFCQTNLLINTYSEMLFDSKTSRQPPHPFLLWNLSRHRNSPGSPVVIQDLLTRSSCRPNDSEAADDSDSEFQRRNDSKSEIRIEIQIKIIENNFSIFFNERPIVQVTGSGTKCRKSSKKPESVQSLDF